MEQRLSLVTLGVSDLQRSIRFYEALGWQRSMRAAEGVAFFQAPGIAFGLYPIESITADTGLVPGRTGFGGVVLSHNAREREDVDRLLNEATTAGATLVKAGHEVSWGGYVGYFRDPDGYLWEVAWNPAFPIDAAGNITLLE